MLEPIDGVKNRPSKIEKYLPLLSNAPASQFDIEHVYPRAHDMLLPEDTEVDVIEDLIITPRRAYTIAIPDEDIRRKRIPGKELDAEVYMVLKKKIERMVRKQQRYVAGDKKPSFRIKLKLSQTVKAEVEE